MWRFFLSHQPVSGKLWNGSLLVVRVAFALQLFLVHGAKKIGWGAAEAEVVPNPLGLPDGFNQAFAVVANVVCPLFILIGFYMRIAVLAPFCVTFIGWAVVHWNDAPMVKDIPFMYSIFLLLLFMAGPGNYSLDQSRAAWRLG